jgi:hypothetical protein
VGEEVEVTLGVEVALTGGVPLGVALLLEVTLGAAPALRLAVGLAVSVPVPVEE